VPANTVDLGQMPLLAPIVRSPRTVSVGNTRSPDPEMTDLRQECTVTMTLGAISPPVTGRRVMPTRGLVSGNDPAEGLHRLAMWLQGRPRRGHTARLAVEPTIDARSVNHSGETVWGKACGCACG
jgi:hypothetical protein